MLEGKPSGENDIVTMRAIRSILSDYENEFVSPKADKTDAKTNAPKTSRAVTSDADATLRPVQELSDRVRAPKFTTVPGQDMKQERAVSARIDPRNPTNAAPKSAQPAPAAAPKAKRAARRSVKAALPKVALPKLPTPAFIRFITPRLLATLVLVGLAMLYPALIVVPFVLTLVGVTGAFVLLGSDRVWNGVSRALNRYERRAPKRAAKLLDRLDAFAVHWDAFLDRFPEGAVDGLYMPDFANYDDTRAQQDAALDARLERMHSQV